MKTYDAPVMPHGAKFDPNVSVIQNAANAWEREQFLQRRQGEHNARVLARRVFKTDDFAFTYDPVVSLTVPLITVEAELIGFFPHTGQFALIEFCSECGKEFDQRPFNSLATLGRKLAERAEDDAFVCRICKIIKGK